MKPEPIVFQELAKALGVEVSELVYIDDAEKSLSTAEQVGYQPILYTGYVDLLERLRELDILSEEEMRELA
jgi:beta-phosphoglucomutase-like phosphatase (HAD superfamily)